MCMCYHKPRARRVSLSVITRASRSVDWQGLLPHWTHDGCPTGKDNGVIPVHRYVGSLCHADTESTRVASLSAPRCPITSGLGRQVASGSVCSAACEAGPASDEAFPFDAKAFGQHVGSVESVNKNKLAAIPSPRMFPSGKFLGPSDSCKASDMLEYQRPFAWKVNCVCCAVHDHSACIRKVYADPGDRTAVGERQCVIYDVRTDSHGIPRLPWPEVLIGQAKRIPCPDETLSLCVLMVKEADPVGHGKLMSRRSKGRTSVLLVTEGVSAVILSLLVWMSRLKLPQEALLERPQTKFMKDQYQPRMISALITAAATVRLLNLLEGVNQAT